MISSRRAPSNPSLRGDRPVGNAGRASIPGAGKPLLLPTKPAPAVPASALVGTAFNSASQAATNQSLPPNPVTVRTGIRGTSYSALDHIIHGLIVGSVVGCIFYWVLLRG